MPMVRPPPDERHTPPRMWSPGFVVKLRLPAGLFTISVSVRDRRLTGW